MMQCFLRINGSFLPIQDYDFFGGSHSRDIRVNPSWFVYPTDDLFYEPMFANSKQLKSTSLGEVLAASFKQQILNRNRAKNNGRPGLHLYRYHRRTLSKIVKAKPRSSVTRLRRNQDHSPSPIRKCLREKGSEPEDPLEHISFCKYWPTVLESHYEISRSLLPVTSCDPLTNNFGRLYHYRIEILPKMKVPRTSISVITYNSNEYTFAGFSILTHKPLSALEKCKFNCNNTQYTIQHIEDVCPTNFTVLELQLFEEYLLRNVLENDLYFVKPTGFQCTEFHLYPRWEHASDNGAIYVMPVAIILSHILSVSGVLTPTDSIPQLATSQDEWNAFASDLIGMIVSNHTTDPHCMRVDRMIQGKLRTYGKRRPKYKFPTMIHQGPIPSVNISEEYPIAIEDYKNYRYLISIKNQPSFDDKRILLEKALAVRNLRFENKAYFRVSARTAGYYNTGLRSDVVQNVICLPILIDYLRYDTFLKKLEDKMQYRFKNRDLLHVALTHSTYNREFITNYKIQWTLENVGIEETYFSLDNKNKKDTVSEHLEVVGVSAIVTSLSYFIIKNKLKWLRADLEEFENFIFHLEILAVFAKQLELNYFMKYSHCVELCHQFELKHVLADGFVALMGALFIDGGYEIIDKVFDYVMTSVLEEVIGIWIKSHEGYSKNVESYHGYLKHRGLSEPKLFNNEIGTDLIHYGILNRARMGFRLDYENIKDYNDDDLEEFSLDALETVTTEYFRDSTYVEDNILAPNTLENKNKMRDYINAMYKFCFTVYIEKNIQYWPMYFMDFLDSTLENETGGKDWSVVKPILLHYLVALKITKGREAKNLVYNDGVYFKIIRSNGTQPTGIAIFHENDVLAIVHGDYIQEVIENTAETTIDTTYGKGAVSKYSTHGNKFDGQPGSSVTYQDGGFTIGYSEGSDDILMVHAHYTDETANATGVETDAPAGNSDDLKIGSSNSTFSNLSDIADLEDIFDFPIDGE